MASVPFRSPSGAVVAYCTLMPVRDAESASMAPLAETDEEDAREHGETTVQLRESERYEYEVVPASALTAPTFFRSARAEFAGAFAGDA